MQVEVTKQFFLNSCGNAITKQYAIRYDYACAAWLRLPPELTHDQLQEEQGSFRSLLVGGEVALNAAFLLAAEGWVGEDDVNTVTVTDLAKRLAQAVAKRDTGVFQP